MFFPYDLEDYQKNTSFMAPYNDLTPGPHVFSQEDFITALKALLAGADEFSKKRVRLNDLLNGKLKEPSRDSYDFIARRVRYRN